VQKSALVVIALSLFARAPESASSQVDVATISLQERRTFDSDTEDDLMGYLRALPLRLDPPSPPPDADAPEGSAPATAPVPADDDAAVKRQKTQ